MSVAAAVLVAATAAGGTEPWRHIQGELHPEDYVPGQCAAHFGVASPSKPLEFCEWHARRYSCCTPMHDKVAHEFFSGMTELGLACARSDHRVKRNYLRLRHWACLACDGHEPIFRYNVYEGYTANNILPVLSSTPAALVVTVNGTTSSSLPAIGAGTYYDPLSGLAVYHDGVWRLVVTRLPPTAPGASLAQLLRAYTVAEVASGPVTPTFLNPEQVPWGDQVQVDRRGVQPVKFKWRICKSFLDGLWNGSGLSWQIGGHTFDECGLTHPSLGPIIPSSYFRGAGGGEAFLRSLLPPNFDTAGGFDFDVIDDTATDFHCRNCTIAFGLCTNCSNGCRYVEGKDTPGRCVGFNQALTPCFVGEDLELPGTLAGGSAAPSVLLAALLILLACL